MFAGETPSFSSEEASDGSSLNTDGSDGSETYEESNSQKEDPKFFSADFEKTGNTSDTESMVDTIDYFARSFSGLSFLSDVGFEDVVQQEDKVDPDFSKILPQEVPLNSSTVALPSKQIKIVNLETLSLSENCINCPALITLGKMLRCKL